MNRKLLGLTSAITLAATLALTTGMAAAASALPLKSGQATAGACTATSKSGPLSKAFPTAAQTTTKDADCAKVGVRITYRNSSGNVVTSPWTYNAAGTKTAKVNIVTTEIVKSEHFVQDTKGVSGTTLLIGSGKGLSGGLRALGFAQGQIGKTGTYADGGFWCDEFMEYIHAKAGVKNVVSQGSPAVLYYNLQSRQTDKPVVGGMVFIDLYGPGGPGHGQITHVGIVESVVGNTITSIEGNADESQVVVRKTHTVGDGFAVGYTKP